MQCACRGAHTQVHTYTGPCIPHLPCTCKTCSIREYYGCSRYARHIRYTEGPLASQELAMVGWVCRRRRARMQAGDQNTPCRTYHADAVQVRTCRTHIRLIKQYGTDALSRDVHGSRYSTSRRRVPPLRSPIGPRARVLARSQASWARSAVHSCRSCSHPLGCCNLCFTELLETRGSQQCITQHGPRGFQLYMHVTQDMTRRRTGARGRLHTPTAQRHHPINWDARHMKHPD